MPLSSGNRRYSRRERASDGPINIFVNVENFACVVHITHTNDGQKRNVLDANGMGTLSSSQITVTSLFSDSELPLHRGR